jgi:methionine--tRNA ligase beta chain
VKPAIGLSVLESLDIRLGTIEDVQDVTGSKKLVKLTVSFGDHRRTILAGMKQERADAREIVGRQALFLVNLEPKHMAGETSEGMLIDIGYADGRGPGEHRHQPASPTRPAAARGALASRRFHSLKAAG